FDKDLFYMKNIKPHGYTLKSQIGSYVKGRADHMISIRRHKRYLANLTALETASSPSQKFVYFPLHLQPEMTTSALGGIFEDQIFALSCLSSKIPVDWCILVKE